jgi:hypothetical protein
VRSLAAIVLAASASSLYALSTALQALEARAAPPERALRSSLLRNLVRRRIWLAGAAAGLVAWPLQAIALALASVALVQPALGLGLVVLLVLGVRLLGERVGTREVVGATAIAASVAVLGWAAPAHTGSFSRAGKEAVVVWLVVVVVTPYALRALGQAGGLATSVAAGLGWGWVGLGTALVDGAIADRHWAVTVAWGVAVGAASWSTLLAEMTALQVWPATRAVPVAFGLEMVAPAAAAPALTHQSAGPWHGVPFALALLVACAGAALLGSSRTVARTVHADPLTGP